MIVLRTSKTIARYVLELQIDLIKERRIKKK